MNRKIIAMATLAAMISPAVFAESGNVSIYGKIDMSMDSISNGNGTTATTQGARSTKVSSNASRIGFKGAEDIGGAFLRSGSSNRRSMSITAPPMPARLLQETVMPV